MFIVSAGFLACDGGEDTDCVCTSDGCTCPPGYGSEQVEVFITYALHAGQEADEKGMEIEGRYQLLYENAQPAKVSCKSKLQDTDEMLQCSLGMLPVESDLYFMVMVPDGEEQVAACQSEHRSECRGKVRVEILRESGKSEVLDTVMATDSVFEHNVAYRVRLEF
ncbi:hypothetical protein GF391_02475 [Candidatus Uhrbacteria bacterium]|nr:hypothetical protein [Candidatus Uhrbacteria bacterium]